MLGRSIADVARCSRCTVPRERGEGKGDDLQSLSARPAELVGSPRPLRSTSLWASLRPYSRDGGVYVNFVTDLAEGGDALARAAYGGNYDRLVALKNRYDPTNLFRANVNTRPAV